MELEAILEAWMLELPGGAIALRDDRKQLQWEVELQPFCLACVPTTQALYFAVTQQRPASHPDDQAPVEGVSWFDALRFCNGLSQALGLSPCYQLEGAEVTYDEAASGYRLPTDAEWEYACRAGLRKVRYGELDDIAWFEDNSHGRTHPVAQKAPNPWGLYDMLGNVWEWCWDLYDPQEYGNYRIFRGGGWADPARGCLASNRRRSHPTYAIDDLGFRIARSLHPRHTQNAPADQEGTHGRRL